MIHVFKGRTEEENDKVEKVLAKLCQINCISNQAVVEWACNSINAKEATVSYEDLSLEFNMIIQALQREASQKWLTVTLYQQRPPTVAAAEGAEGGNDQTSGHGEDGAEESKQRGNDIKMEGLGEADGGAAGDDGNNQDGGRNRGYNARRRLTLEEYEE